MQQMLQLHFGTFTLNEIVSYPNGGTSFFYTGNDAAVIIDKDICRTSPANIIFPYSLITDRQNSYMHRYRAVYRFLYEDMQTIDNFISNINDSVFSPVPLKLISRSGSADVTPLEQFFEDSFAAVYGCDSLRFLSKEYSIADKEGNTYILDYYLDAGSNKYGIEENGIHYHHPQITGFEKYRHQLKKQNTCTGWGIKLFRFSTEDCRFSERIQDDIRTFFGSSTDCFKQNGLLVNRPVQLYEHQKTTLSEIQKKRTAGIHTFLIVFPTATGKSKIIEEDIKIFAEHRKNFHALILAPQTNIIADWNKRISEFLPQYRSSIQVVSYAWMYIHYTETDPSFFDYIVVDEAHHAVADVLKRVIQYFKPEFLAGLTATDQRPDNKKLESIFGSYTTSLSLQDAMQQKIIAQANVYRIETNIDLSEVRINGKEYVNADLEKNIRVTSRNQLIADVIKEYFCQDGFEAKQGIIFCVSTQHASEMERIMNDAGICSKAYTSQSRNAASIMNDFKDRKIRFLCVCNMISEGWDYPELGILVMARPTLSKVLYLQQIGRGLRRTPVKESVFVIDVVDRYGAMVQPCTMHSIFHNPYYVPFGNILKRDYVPGDFIVVEGFHEQVERIVQIDVTDFNEKYGDYLSTEQLAREFFISTSTVTNWIKKGTINPTVSFKFGSRQIYLFSPDDVEHIRIKQNIQEHNEHTVKTDFYVFLSDRDYALSYKMIFMLAFIKNMDICGDAKTDRVLADYISFYKNRLEHNLVPDREICPYTIEYLSDQKKIKENMLTNPFEKFERKRFMYYSKDLNVISMNHALISRLDQTDIQKIKKQMLQDLEQYYQQMGGLVQDDALTAWAETAETVTYKIKGRHSDQALSVADHGSFTKNDI